MSYCVIWNHFSGLLGPGFYSCDTHSCGYGHLVPCHRIVEDIWWNQNPGYVLMRPSWNFMLDSLDSQDGWQFFQGFQLAAKSCWILVGPVSNFQMFPVDYCRHLNWWLHIYSRVTQDVFCGRAGWLSSCGILWAKNSNMSSLLQDLSEPLIHHYICASQRLLVQKSIF